MPLRPLDELDNLEEIGLSRLLPLRRICSSKACRGTARSGGRHCLACHARAVQRYRDRHGQQLATRRRDAAAMRDEATCTAAEVLAIIEDPQQWRDVVWVCRLDRDEARERQRDEQAELVRARERAAWADERTQVLAAIELLPPNERAQLHALAAQGPAGCPLSPEAPLYVMNLVRVYRARFSRGAP